MICSSGLESGHVKNYQTPIKGEEKEETKKDYRVYTPLAGTTHFSSFFSAPIVPTTITNKIFFLLKPHANTHPTVAFVQDWLASQGFSVLDCTSVSGRQLLTKFRICFKEFIRVGLQLRCSEYSIPHPWKIAFHNKFGFTWSEALEMRILYNAADCLRIFEFTPEHLYSLWMTAVSHGRVVSLDSHFQCALLDCIPEKGSVVCVNGYLPALEAQYSSLCASVTCFNVTWADDTVITWTEFLQQMIGDENPEFAADGSLRKIIHDEWAELGLPSPPNIIDNCIHVSRGAFEAFADRSLWLDVPWMEDPVGSRLYSLGLTPAIVANWLQNPILEGKRLFSILDSLGTEETLLAVKELSSSAQNIVSPSPRFLSPSPKVFSRPRLPTSINTAFIYLRPMLSRSKSVVSIVKDILMTKGFIIKAEGVLSSLSERIVDRHFSVIAEVAIAIKPRQLKLPPSSFIQFQKKFCTSWGKELASENIMNAADSAAFLQITYHALYDLWLQADENDQIVELESGVLCGLLRTADATPKSIFCVNGFYPGLRAQYTAPYAILHFFQIDWVSHHMNWEQFIARVIGKGLPAEAQPNSIKNLLYTDWKSLQLKEQPSRIDECIHASGSAFEGMAELFNWLRQPITENECGKKLLQAGIPLETINSWMKNPRIRGGRVFDLMKYRGTEECCGLALQILSSQSQSTPSPHRQLTPLPPLTPPISRFVSASYSSYLNRSTNFIVSPAHLQSSSQIPLRNPKERPSSHRKKKQSVEYSSESEDERKGSRILTI